MQEPRPISKKKLFIIAGEASGDKHAAEAVSILKTRHPDWEFYGLGGLHMQKAGVNISENLVDISVMGFGDVLRQYFKFRKIFYQALASVKTIQPDLIVLVDYPGFNLRFAKILKRQFPICYYISPQIWAWGGRRIHLIRKIITRMLVLFPFEEKLYRKAGVPADFVGHPMTTQVKASASRENLREEWGEPRRLIAILPGSRRREVTRILPAMLKACRLLKKEFPDLAFLLAEVGYLGPEVYSEILANYPDLNIQRTVDRSYDAVSAADFSIVTSGTATLETTLLKAPYVLVYKTAWSTYLLGRMLIQIKYIGLANILLDKKSFLS